MQEYSSREIMAITAGRMIQDGDILFCGTGLSLIAATAAKKLYAPKSVIFFETGGIDTELPELPLAVADLRVMYGTSINAGLLESFSILGHRKLHTRAFLGAAQIDRYGNLNSTCIGEYLHPSVRFSGSGGGCDAACLAAEVIIFMEHNRDRFVEKLDYLTSPGWLSGREARDRAGLYRGGPSTVVTDLGVMKFDENTKHMYLYEHYPGVSPEQVHKNTGFEIDVSRAVLTAKVTAEELRVLREEVDPQKLII
jgi:glutaconate CoA-transferase subunit B